MCTQEQLLLLDGFKLLQGGVREDSVLIQNWPPWEETCRFEGQVDKDIWYIVNVTFQIHWLAFGKTVQNSITLDVNVKRI